MGVSDTVLHSHKTPFLLEPANMSHGVNPFGSEINSEANSGCVKAMAFLLSIWSACPAHTAHPLPLEYLELALVTPSVIAWSWR